MSLFEKIKNKRTSLQEKATKDETPLKDRVNKGSGSRTTRVGGKIDPIKQKAEAEYVKYTDDLARKRGITGKNPGKKLEKEVDIGLKKQDGTIGKRTPSKGYAQGEPFQGNTNVKDPTGRYPASGRSTLKGRQRYQFDVTKTSRKDAAKDRLVTRIRNVEDPFFADKGGRQDVKKITKYVDDITKNQKLSKATGKKSTLFKTLKSYTDAKNPTVQGGGKPARFVKGKDGVVRQYGGGKVPMPDGPKRDAQIKKNLKALDDKIARQAKLPKGTYIPKGGVFPKSTFPTDAKGKPQILKGIKDKKTGKITPPTKVKVSDKLSVPFEPKETNIQYKADKLDLDYGKRFSQRDTLTAAERKRKLQKLKTDLNIKNPTITSPLTGGRIPATAANLKKFNLPPLTKTKSFKTPPLSKPLYQKSGIISPKKIKMGTPLRNRFKSRSAVGTTLALAGAAYLLTKGNKPKPKNNNNKPIILPPGQKIISTGQSGVKFNLAGPGGGRLKLPNASDPSK